MTFERHSVYNYTPFLLGFLFTMLFACSKEENSNNPALAIPNNITAPDNGIFNELVRVTIDTIDLDSLHFFFNDHSVAYFAQVSSTEIDLQIPRTLEDVNSNLRIYYGREDDLIFNQAFTLRPPVIASISEVMVTFGDTLTIYGNDFDVNEYTRVLFNGTSSTVINGSKDSVVAVIPNDLTQPILSVKVQAQLQEDELINVLTLKEPQIISAPGFTQIGAVIELTGENFNLNPSAATVILNGDLETTVVSVQSNEEISIQIPYGPFKDFEIHSIEYSTAGMSTTYATPIFINSGYVLFTKEDSAAISQPFSYNNQIFGMGRPPDAEYDDPYTLWRLNTDNQLWENFPDTSIPFSDFTFHVSPNGMLYIYINGHPTENFYRINLQNQTLESLADFPGSTRSYPALISSVNRVVLGKGKAIASETYYQDLFSYDENMNSWSSLSTDDSKLVYYNDFDTWNGNNYMMAHYFRPSTGGELSLRAIVKFDPSQNTFSKEYSVCTSCSIEELMVFNNKFYTAYNNGLNMGFRNLDNNNDFITIPGSSFFTYGTQNYVTDGEHVYFWGQVLNTPLQNKGYYKVNPSVF
jgi:IPT/TIG domain